MLKRLADKVNSWVLKACCCRNSIT